MAEQRLFDDTPLPVERILVEGYRRMSPAEKLRRVDSAIRSIRTLVAAAIAAEHPEEGERERRVRLVRRLLDLEAADALLRRGGEG